jgi:hypothetical protein
MKFDKWTVALAAVGVVSLASAAKAEEKASSVMTALSSTTLSGYVDTSAQWNFGTGNGHNPPYKFNSPTKADGFNLDVVQLRIEKPLDEAEWAAGYRVDLWMGPDANTLNTQSAIAPGTRAGQSDFAIRQAYVALRTPVGNGIDWKIGVFDSIVGYESVESPNDPNYTRSYGHSIEPQTHTGILGTYRFTDMISASAGVANTWTPIINDRSFAPVTGQTPTTAESYKTYMASIALTAPDTMGALSGSTLYAGFVNGFADSTSGNPFLTAPNPAGSTKPLNVSSYYVGATVATPVTGLRLGAAFDYLDIHRANNDNYSFAGYASYQATEKLSFHGRAEYYKDKLSDAGGTLLAFPTATAGIGTGQGAEVLALTATVQYDLWKNVITRGELRWDHSLGGNDLFGSSSTGLPTAENAWLLAANIIYKF